MKCLCRNKELDPLNKEEMSNLWHKRCINNFFGGAVIPEITLNEEEINKMIYISINEGYTIQGVQKKLSLGIIKTKDKRMTLVNDPVGYILKLESKYYKEIVMAEFVSMSLANLVGLKTVPFGIIKINNEYAYITKRIDRFDHKNKKVILAMEDFQQLQNRLSEDKYKGSYERIAKTINEYSLFKKIDIINFYNVLIFSFIIGNSDMHLKNFSLIETSENSNEYRLAPFYDLLCTNIIIPNDNEEMALSLNGKKRNITKNDFLDLAKNLEIDQKIATKLILKMISYKEDILKTIDESLLSDKFKKSFKNLAKERIERLS